MNETNYAIPFKLDPDKYPTSEITCMNCMTTFYVQKILGPDTVWRQLPAWCRKCESHTVIAYKADEQ